MIATGMVRSLMTIVIASAAVTCRADDWWKPYRPPCVERESVFAFAEKPSAKLVGKDRYEITFAVEGNCDVTVELVDEDGGIVRHLASGVLGPNAPAPFRKNVKKQTLVWDGKDDLQTYVKAPGRLRVRVRLGLKAAFERLLGWQPTNLIGTYRGVAADKDGIYVVSGTNPQVRRYDRDGNYVRTICPPPADVAMDRFKGFEALEYEPGKEALHVHIGHSPSPGGLPVHPAFSSTVSAHGRYFPGGLVVPHQMCVLNGLLIWASAGKTEQVVLYRMNTSDGGSDDVHFAWRPLSRSVGKGKYAANAYFDKGEFSGAAVTMALSPDKRWLYLSGLGGREGASTAAPNHAVYRLDTRTRKPLGTKPWLGHDTTPGSDNTGFNAPSGIACDPQGRVYVCDQRNNRIQVFAADAKHLKTIEMERPQIVRVHPKTEALYVVHTGREGGKGTSRRMLVRLRGLDDPSVTAHFVVNDSDKQSVLPILTLDTWSLPLRLWLTRGPSRLVILEERGDGFEVIRDLAAEARESDFPHHADLVPGPWEGLIACDPIRRKVYVGNAHIFDLETGGYEGGVSFPWKTADIAFDKRGYLHMHFDPGFYTPGVARVDPDQVAEKTAHGVRYKEVPYDYGVEKASKGREVWKGVLPVRDQPVSKWQQDGLAVNMMGDVAEVGQIAHVPKMEDTVKPLFTNMKVGTTASHSYAGFRKWIDELAKRGEERYFIRRRPGRRLHGCTVWVWDRSGELRTENIVPGAPLVNGVGIDEDGAVYFVFASTRMVGGRPFLSGRGRIIGTDKKSFHPFTGTLIKAPAGGAQILSRQAPIAMDPWPDRPPDTAGRGYGWNSTGDTDWTAGKNGGWAEGAEWLYAGACPIVPISCICPCLRIHTDWHKRTFVPEAYRHSVGVLDAAGNLIAHIGRYGNADSGRGPESPVKIGSDEIAFAHVMTVSATDRRLCLTDFANERILVLKLEYHAEETAQVATE